MRLSVFLANKSSAQLLLDLKKIYQNYFTDNQLTSGSLQALIENNTTQLYMTMFNERHLGAVQVTVDNKQAQLSLLTVRDLTRRKGIAKNLLNEVEKQLKIAGITEVKMDLSTIQEEEKKGVNLFMLAVGYKLIGAVFTKTL